MIIREGRIGEIYNVGGHNEKTNIEIVKTILDELGKGYHLIDFVKDRPGHDRRYAINPKKISEELGWSPNTKFKDGIKKTIKWYLKRRDWWEDMIIGKEILI